MMNVRKFLYLVFEKPGSVKYGFLIQKILLFIIVLNILSFTLPYLFNLNHEVVAILRKIEFTTTFLFLVELILRYYAIGYHKDYQGLKGLVSYTLQPYTLIDIVAVLPLFPIFDGNFAFLRLARFSRALKLLRMKETLRKILSLNYFASSPIYVQIAILFTMSVLTIVIFSYAYESIKMSFLIFLSPTEIINTHTIRELIIGVFEFIIGLIIGGSLISIITSTLVAVTEAAKNGLLPYKGQNHIVIINQNSTLEYILQEIDKYYSVDNANKKDIVVFETGSADFEKFAANFQKYNNINLFLVSGEPLNWNSYLRTNINKAEKVLFLTDVKQPKNLNRKQVRYILQNKNFTNRNLEFIIQDYDSDHLDEIYASIFDGYDREKYVIVKYDRLLDKFLNRTIVNNLYFVIFRELLTYDGFEIYILESEIFFDQLPISFFDAYLRISDAVLIGVTDNNQIIINPGKEFKITIDHQLILIMEDPSEYDVLENVIESKCNISIEPPHVQEDRKICVVGDYSDVKIENIVEFLSKESVENIVHIVEEDYFDIELWNRLRREQPDIDAIIMNLEDNYELDVTLFLREVFKNDQQFLSKIINVLNNTNIALLLEDEKYPNNIILSEKIVGEFLSKILFQKEINEIFDELTHTYGNEFYILSKEKYTALFYLSYHELKRCLASNNMLYVGAFVDEKFIFDYKNINNNNIRKIVVLAKGLQ